MNASRDEFHRVIATYLRLNIGIRYPRVSLARSSQTPASLPSSAMDSCLLIFLILGIVSVWPSNSKTSGNYNSSKKKKNTTRLSAGIANNPFLHPPVTLPSVESNPFLLQFYSNKSESQSGAISNISLPTENQSSYGAIFSSGNPFLNYGPDSKNDTVPLASGPFTPVTQAPYRPSFYYTPASPRPQLPTTQRPFFEEVRPPTTSLLDLIPIKIGSEKTRSEFKCEGYVREIVGTTNVTSLVGTSTNVIKLENTCRNVNNLVVGGTEAKVGEFPHMVALGKRSSSGEFTLMCGGSLISHTWVLSAAHCTYGPNGGPSDARMGMHSLTDQQSGITITIKTTLRHPEFRAPAMYSDIALIELKNAVLFSELIRPACLYQQYDNVPTAAWISGWGATEFTGDQSDKLRKAQLNFIDNLACTIRLNSSTEIPYGVSPSMICAGDPIGGWTKDSCQGDSGGPLQVIHPNNQCLFQVIGITSFGVACAAVGSPGVYTRVSHYLPWIENIVWPQGR